MSIKIIVAIIVYNRYSNIERWLKCWQQCNQDNAELIVIHTGEEIEKFSFLCYKNNVTYINRQNIGFDIGCMQDVFKERLLAFPNDWTHLLWITDDTFPMSKDFITPFLDKLENPQVGIACMQISRSVNAHIRTTGFCIRKEESLKINFNVDPVVTKQHCYFFEHRGGDKTFTNQIRRMGLNCEAVAKDKVSPLWDSGYWKRLDRQAEHDKLFGFNNQVSDKVTFICTIYNTYPQIISSLILQTHLNWELILIHDGPNETGLKELINGDARIKYIETKERKQNYGHYWRQWALNEIKLGDFVTISNADNYYVPTFIEYMLKGFKSHTSVATFCSQMVHSYKAWDVIDCRLERGYLDCGGVMVKSVIAKEIGWKDITDHSADWKYFNDIAASYSWSNFIKVKGCLFTHN